MPSGAPVRRALLIAYPLAGGVPRHVSDLAVALGERRWSVDVACPRESWTWTALQGRPGIRLHRLPGNAGVSPADLAAWARLIPLVRRADVVHAHSSKAGFFVRFAAFVAGRRRRCVFSPHAWSFLGFTGWRRAVLVAGERIAARWCAAIIAVSSDEQAIGGSQRIGRPDQLRLIYNGVHLDRFQRERHPEPGTIVMAVRLKPQKRPVLAVRAMAELVATVPSARLLVLGDGPLRPDVERAATERGVESAVQVVGYRDDVPDVLARASCLLLTSDYEGFPLCVLEAMAAGVPVVATLSPGTRELIHHGTTGLLVPPTASAIASALREVLTEPARAAELAARARAEVQRYSYERMLDAVEALYEEVASS